MIIAVDFDGVICDCDFQEGIEGAFETLKYAKSLGHKLILWTSKSERYLVNAVEFCADHGVVFDAINANAPNSPWYCHPKIHADLFLDDKSFPPFSGWKEFEAYLRKKKLEDDFGRPMELEEFNERIYRVQAEQS